LRDPAGQQAGLALVHNGFVTPEIDFVVVVVVLTMCYSMPYFFLTAISLAVFMHMNFVDLYHSMVIDI
jgi:hypothetical protein